MANPEHLKTCSMGSEGCQCAELTIVQMQLDSQVPELFRAVKENLQRAVTAEQERDKANKYLDEVLARADKTLQERNEARDLLNTMKFSLGIDAAFRQERDTALQERDAARKDVNLLNNAMRQLGWGQGEIDSYTVEVERMEPVMEAAREIERSTLFTGVEVDVPFPTGEQISTRHLYRKLQKALTTYDTAHGGTCTGHKAGEKCYCFGEEREPCDGNG